LPLVLNLHGGMGKAELQRRMSGMNAVADKHGFIVVYPDGTGLTRMLTFNAGSCCGYAKRVNVDDVGFINALLDDVEQRYKVDPHRVYATGFSNGAMMCYRLACELSHRLAAVAPVSGDLGVDGPLPRRPVPIIHFHGLEDQNSPFHGGVGTNQFQPTPHRSIPDTIDWWVKANHCESQPVRSEVAADFERKEYQPRAGVQGAPIVLYVLPKGGHSWPGGEDVAAHLGTGNLVKSVNASELIWEFFQQHPLP
jgi:polyhydroxybutyrate depolymerase